MFFKFWIGLLEFFGLFGFWLVKGLATRGTLLYINVNGSPTSFSKIGNVTDFSGPGGQATVLDASNLESVMKEKLMGLPDEGQFTFTINLDPDDTTHQAVRDARKNKTLCEFKLTLTDTTATNIVFFGYVLGFQISGGVDQVLKAAVTVEVDGPAAWA